MTGYTRHPASYRDPSGFIFQVNGRMYRQVNKVAAGNYDHFIRSGLYQLLVEKNFLIAHTEIKENLTGESDWHLTLLPEPLPFISYPYEWCFEQLKDAALLTLSIMTIAVEKGMILKDATPLNIQFRNGQPVFIDTLSFEIYDPSQPWIAYRQFCETFLYPLWLTHYHKTGFQKLLGIYPEGIPVSLAAPLFPARSRFNAGVWLHVRLPDKMKNRKTAGNTNYRFSEKKLLNLVEHLRLIIQKLEYSHPSAWSHYYREDIKSGDYLPEKEKIVGEMLSLTTGKKLLDLGANEGQFSFLAAGKGYDVVAVDSDEQCINNFYQKQKKAFTAGLLPLCMDLTNPSSSSGFENRERKSFFERVEPDIVLALALIHHLAIGKSIPLPMLASFLARLAPQLIVEFVPKTDEKTQLLLMNKKDIYPDYTREGFESCFLNHFSIESQNQVSGTERIIYLMKKK